MAFLTPLAPLPLAALDALALEEERCAAVAAEAVAAVADEGTVMALDCLWRTWCSSVWIFSCLRRSCGRLKALLHVCVWAGSGG